jgi:hypothetical protein
MLSPETRAEIPAWNERKMAQWEAVQKATPGVAGLQLARHGEQRSTFMLTISTDDFYESVIFGQLPHVVKIPKSKTRRPEKPEDWRDAKEDEKPREKRRIDFSNSQLGSVLALWGQGKSALELGFIASVWGVDGLERVKSS